MFSGLGDILGLGSSDTATNTTSGDGKSPNDGSSGVESLLSYFGESPSVSHIISATSPAAPLSTPASTPASHNNKSEGEGEEQDNEYDDAKLVAATDLDELSKRLADIDTTSNMNLFPNSGIKPIDRKKAAAEKTYNFEEELIKSINNSDTGTSYSAGSGGTPNSSQQATSTTKLTTPVSSRYGPLLSNARKAPVGDKIDKGGGTPVATATYTSSSSKNSNIAASGSSNSNINSTDSNVSDHNKSNSDVSSSRHAIDSGSDGNNSNNSSNDNSEVFMKIIEEEEIVIKNTSTFSKSEMDDVISNYAQEIDKLKQEIRLKDEKMVIQAQKSNALLEENVQFLSKAKLDIESLSSRLQNNKEIIDQHVANEAVIKQEVASLKNEIQRLKSENTSLSSKFEDFQASAKADTESMIAQHRDTCSQKDSNIYDLQQKLLAVSEKMKDIVKKYSESKKKEHQEINEGFEDKLKTVSEQLQQKDSELTGFKLRYENLEQAIQTQRRLNSDYQERINILTVELKASKTQLSSEEKKTVEFDSLNSQLRAMNDKFKADFESAIAENNRLDAEISFVRENEAKLKQENEALFVKLEYGSTNNQQTEDYKKRAQLALKNANARAAALEVDKTALQTELDDALAKISTLESKNGGLESAIAISNANKLDIEQARIISVNEIDSLKVRISENIAEIDVLRSQVDIANQEISKLTSMLDVEMSQNRNTSNSHNDLVTSSRNSQSNNNVISGSNNDINSSKDSSSYSSNSSNNDINSSSNSNHEISTNLISNNEIGNNRSSGSSSDGESFIGSDGSIKSKILDSKDEDQLSNPSISNRTVFATTLLEVGENGDFDDENDMIYVKELRSQIEELKNSLNARLHESDILQSELRRERSNFKKASARVDELVAFIDRTRNTPFSKNAIPINNSSSSDQTVSNCSSNGSNSSNSGEGETSASKALVVDYSQGGAVTISEGVGLEYLRLCFVTLLSTPLPRGKERMRLASVIAALLRCDPKQTENLISGVASIQTKPVLTQLFSASPTPSRSMNSNTGGFIEEEGYAASAISTLSSYLGNW